MEIKDLKIKTKELHPLALLTLERIVGMYDIPMDLIGVLTTGIQALSHYHTCVDEVTAKGSCIVGTKGVMVNPAVTCAQKWHSIALASLKMLGFQKIEV